MLARGCLAADIGRAVQGQASCDQVNSPRTPMCKVCFGSKIKCNTVGK